MIISGYAKSSFPHPPMKLYCIEVRLHVRSVASSTWQLRHGYTIIKIVSMLCAFKMRSANLEPLSLARCWINIIWIHTVVVWMWVWAFLNYAVYLAYWRKTCGVWAACLGSRPTQHHLKEAHCVIGHPPYHPLTPTYMTSQHSFQLNDRQHTCM